MKERANVESVFLLLVARLTSITMRKTIMYRECGEAAINKFDRIVRLYHLSGTM